MTGSILSALAGCAYLSLAAGAVAAPETLGENYGIAVTGDAARAYLRATGARDGVLGLMLLTFLATGRRDALTATVALSALVGASDFAIVLGTRGRSAPKSLAIHGIGTLGLLGTAALLRAGG